MKDIKKRIISGVVIGIFVLLPGIKGKASNLGINGKGKTNKQTSLYNNDYLNSNIISNLEINKDIVYLLEGNYYDLINYNNQLGFIEKNSHDNNYVYNNLEYEKINQLGVTTSDVNLRVFPDINNDKISTIKNGEMIEIIFQSNNGWYLVNYDNALGFINSKYAKIINFDKLEQKVNELPKFYNVVVALENVNIRSNPDVNSNKISILKKNKKLLISKVLDNNWIEVVSHDKIGYVNSKYVKKYKICLEPYYKQVYMKNIAGIYNYPYSSIIDYLPKYETAFVYGELDDFYYIEKNGVVGFIRKIDTKELNNKYIVVDISSQTINVFNNEKKIMKSNVVTGKTSTPTYLGDYQIYSKQLNRVLEGPDYSTPVKYWMAFNGGEGFHDASWRSKFGGDIYINNGSHGCVNLPSNIAKKLYDEVSIGTKVLIKE